MRRLAGDALHQLVDEYQFFERLPAGIFGPPIQTRSQPNGERLDEILVRVVLRVVVIEMAHEAFAVRTEAIRVRIGFRRMSEHALPTALAIQIVGISERMPGFVAQKFHAPIVVVPFGFEHHFSLKLDQPRMRQIERNADYRLVLRRQPFIGQVANGCERDIPCLELFVQLRDARFQPRPFDAHRQFRQAQAEQFLVGNRRQIDRRLGGIFLFRGHLASSSALRGHC